MKVKNYLGLQRNPNHSFSLHLNPHEKPHIFTARKVQVLATFKKPGHSPSSHSSMFDPQKIFKEKRRQTTESLMWIRRAWR